MDRVRRVFPDDVGDVESVVVIPAGTVDPNNDLVSIDVLPLVTPGAASVKLKIEPECTPNPAATASPIHSGSRPSTMCSTVASVPRSGVLPRTDADANLHADQHADAAANRKRTRRPARLLRRLRTARHGR